MKEKNKILFIIITGIIFWILYLGDSEMSRYGIYTIFSYNTHELLSVVPFLSIFITAIWLIFFTIKIIRKRDIKSYNLMFVLLIVLLIFQAMYMSDKGQTITTSFVSNIDKINGNTIVIDTDEHDLKLYCPQIVLGLLKTDGTEYLITYEWNKQNPENGELAIVQSIN